MFKKLVVLTSLLICLSLLVACGGLAGAPAAANTGSENSNSGKIHVTVMTWESNITNAAIDEALKSFMAANPDIVVERIPTPNSGYSDKLNAMVQSNQLPDIFWSGNDTAFLYGDQGLLYDWSKYAKAENSNAFRMDQFAPSTVENWTTPDGKLYGLPTLMNTYGFWYNEDLLKAANVPVPKAGWTYDDLFATMKALTVKNGKKITRYGLYNGPVDPFMISDCSVSNGGQPFMDKVIKPTQVTADAKYVACLQKWAEATQNGWVTPPGYPADGLTDQFLAGQVPLLFYGQWFAPIFIEGQPSFKYGFAPMPNADKVVQPYDAVGIASPAYIKNPDAVWKVMKFLSTDAWNTILAKSPVAPPAHLPSTQVYYDTLKADNLSSVADAVKYELAAQDKQGIRFTAPWSAKANDILTAYWEDILLGKKPVDDVQNMVKDINDVIQNSK